MSGDGQRQPFELRSNVVVLKGGGLSKPWVIDIVKTVGDRHFIALDRKDRDLARAIFLDNMEPMPFQGTTLLPYLAVQRNLVVDALILRGQAKNDPMADNDATEDMDDELVINRREAVFKEIGIPDVVDVSLPGFTSDGVPVAGLTMKMIATPRRDQTLMVEATSKNFEWLARAIHTTWSTRGNPWLRKRVKHVDIEELPTLTQPNVRYLRKGYQGIKIQCDYRLKNGNWKPHQRGLGKHIKHMSGAALKEYVADLEKQVQAFYDKHHVAAGRRQRSSCRGRKR